MRYAEFMPAPAQAPLVDRFWLLDGTSAGAPDAIIPDGRVELIFHYGGPFWRHSAAGDPVQQPVSLLVGQMTEPVRLAPDGRAGVAAIRLRSAAARTLLRFPLHEVSGRFLDLELIFPSVRGLCERLAEAGGDQERIHALERWLASQAPAAARPRLESAVGAVLRTNGCAAIDTLAAQAGTSTRQLEREFQDGVGLSPKTFSRIIRLQAALRRVRQGLSLSDVALASGFYDQAHMARDFRELADMSPGAWQEHAGDLAPLFV
jgi:AraC-like DNA-binding protein